jgi:hypothetical protein
VARPERENENQSRLFQFIGSYIDVIHDWMERAQKHEDLMHIPLTFDARTGHLPQLVRDVQPDCDWMSEQRPRSPLRRVLTGTLCRKRGYTAGMLIEESRLLELYLFTTLKAQLNWT